MKKQLQWVKDNMFLCGVILFVGWRAWKWLTAVVFPDNPRPNASSVNDTVAADNSQSHLPGNNAQNSANPADYDAVAREVASNIQLATYNYRKKIDIPWVPTVWEYDLSSSRGTQIHIVNQLNRLRNASHAVFASEEFDRVCYSFDKDHRSLLKAVNTFVSADLRRQVRQVIMSNLK